MFVSYLLQMSISISVFTPETRRNLLKWEEKTTLDRPRRRGLIVTPTPTEQKREKRAKILFSEYLKLMEIECINSLSLNAC